MENEYIMSKKNEEGVLIIKKIPESLCPFYLNIGWQIVNEKPRNLTESIKPENKNDRN